MIGTRLKQLRIDRSLRQKDVADALGITLNAICNYELGIREPSLSMLVKIADFFEVSTDYLLGRSDY